MTEISRILDYLHHVKPSPVIYQDLKAEHVIIGKDGINLIDFGISSFLGDQGNRCQNYGTPEYSAPEKRAEAKIGIQTDIFSLGKLLEALIDAEGKKNSRCLLHVARKASNPDASKRYASAREFQGDLMKHMQSSKNSFYQEHLLSKVTIAGSQPRIGTTHLSVSFTQYLNQNRILAVCREKNSNNHMRAAIRQGGFAEEGGLYRKRYFLGMPAYGDGVEAKVPERAVEVFDYGTDLSGAVAEEADLLLLLVGSREWEEENARIAYETVKNAASIVVIANYGDKRQARKYAGQFGCRVYCFPLDENPFFMTKEKEVLFDGLLEKYRNCRKRLRKRDNALVRGLGKLCGKQAR